MSINKQNPYNVEKHIAEIYDNQNNETQDVELIIKLLKGYGCYKILEPFCGTGRILLPLALSGFKIKGIDSSLEMLKRLENKKRETESESCSNITILYDDVLKCIWGEDYDAVILGGNCFFELATLEEQIEVFHKAYVSIKTGGYIFIDNDSIEDELPLSWCSINVENKGFPSGTCLDGTELKSFVKTVYADKKTRYGELKEELKYIKIKN